MQAIVSIEFVAQEAKESHYPDSICLREQVIYHAEELDESAIPPSGFMAFRNNIQEAIVFPESAMQNGTAGRVSLTFIICPDGEIHQMEVINGKSEDCDAEAIRVLKSMGNWQPGMVNGQSVYSKVRYSVNFRKPED